MFLMYCVSCAVVCDWHCSHESMCKDCVVSGCFVAYNKAQIDKLSTAVSEMAIAPSDPDVRSAY